MLNITTRQKNPCCDELVSPCTNYFDQHHPLQQIEYMLPMFLRQPYPINCLLSSSTTVQCLFFSYIFLFPSQFSPSSVSSPLHVVCLYVYINSFPLLLILWCIYFCLLYLLGCICTVLKVNLLYLSRKLFLTAVLPDGFLSIFPQLLKKFYFLKAYEFSFTVLRNSMYSTISFSSISLFHHVFYFVRYLTHLLIYYLLR